MLEYKYSQYVSEDPIYPSFHLVLKDFNLSKRKVIDLWASNGRYLKYFWKWSCGVEFSDHDIKLAQNANLNVIKWNLNTEFDFFEWEKFDFIFSSHVIEHLDSPYLFLKRIRDFGWENAKLILGYPIEHSLVRLFDPYFSHDGHIYSFSISNMMKLLEETGFEIEKIYYDVPFAGRFKVFNFLQKIVQKLPYYLVSWWSNALYIVIKKK